MIFRGVKQQSPKTTEQEHVEELPEIHCKSLRSCSSGVIGTRQAGARVNAHS
jgi:hypothetical protein